MSELDERIERALRSIALEPFETSILSVISTHRGAANAISSERIASQIVSTVDPRSETVRRVITKAVERLRLEFAIPIGASRVPPRGYFLMETARDYELGTAAIQAELFAHLRLLRALCGRPAVARLYGQQMLQLDSENCGRRAAEAGEAAK